MGCIKENLKKLLLSSFVIVLLFLAITTPVVIGADDTITISFDPTGTVSLAVSPSSVNFSTVAADSTEENETSFTLYNNGTATMSTNADTNGSTADLTLDADGFPMAIDKFSLQLTSETFGDTASPYLTDGGGVINASLTPALGSATFQVSIHLGNISTDHGWQNTLINFTGSVV